MPQNEFNLKIIEEFRANRGETFGPFKGRPLLLLTTTGAKSGEPRTTPLVYTRDGDRMVIIASMGGAPRHPQWFVNLRAKPEVTVEVGTEKFQARASVPDGAERDRLYAAQAAEMPAFNEYQQKTTRRIPVVVLERIS
ncbi:MAG TPA: nitroreductase family deazaflavin-dependent oxidoreductase [Tepidiformaceae bacterium]|nr:nitroreductase family deazaflavin-dependent oxidoreductase [Tepidiformaceae bacterium]